MRAGARRVWRDAAQLLAELDEVLAVASPSRVLLTRARQEEYMRLALDDARDGMRNGEAPIGCVLVDGDGEIVARAYNEMKSTGNKTAHAEIVAFARAAGKTPLDANDLLLVSTLEPCVMCTGAAMVGAVDTILFALRAPADSGSGRVESPESPESGMPRIVGDILADDSRALFEEWLANGAEEPQASYGRQLLERTS
ncbi:MAG TPA: nucleoside deaminase [Gemmatimonas sp.]|nr:nucleoside deaminase [Gemmatimonas sp.]